MSKKQKPMAEEFRDHLRALTAIMNQVGIHPDEITKHIAPLEQIADSVEIFEESHQDQ